MAISSIKAMLVAGMFILVTGAAEAGGNPHQKPCDRADLIGSAYGACNVYCEALDCDGPPDRRQARACEAARNRFFDLTGNVPPCEPVCPCASGWLNPDFVPDVLEATECLVQLSDGGEFIDLRLEGAPDENGDEPLSAAGLNIFDDDLAGYHSFQCFSERYEDQSFALSEDSGAFEMFNGFREEGDQFDRQQNGLFASCKAVFVRIVEENGIECVVDDSRSQ